MQKRAKNEVFGNFPAYKVLIMSSLESLEAYQVNYQVNIFWEKSRSFKNHDFVFFNDFHSFWPFSQVKCIGST